jgi:hypothetical protein
MNEQAFLQQLNSRAKELGISPLLLLSGIEGLYTFRNVRINAINYQFLDSLILTIFALRIGDSFHSIAEENLKSPNDKVRVAAINELMEIDAETIAGSDNQYLQSFAIVLNGKSAIRHYHVKALEVAALEIKKALQSFGDESIGAIIMNICKNDLNESLNFSSWFEA